MRSSSSRLRFGVLLAAAGALALTACGGSGGGSSAPSNFAGGPTTSAGSLVVPTSTLGKATEPGSKGGGTKSSNPVRVSTLPGGRRTTIAGGNGGGNGGGSGGGNGGGGNGGGSGGGSGGSTCTAAAPPKASDPSKAVIKVCPGRSLNDGQQVTITGSHFKPNENLLYMECHYKGENANNYGPSDCTINILNLGASSTRSDASGNVGPITFTVHEKFKSINCASVQCMVTVAVPIQTGTADNPHALIYF